MSSWFTWQILIEKKNKLIFLFGSNLKISQKKMGNSCSSKTCISTTYQDSLKRESSEEIKRLVRMDEFPLHSALYNDNYELVEDLLKSKINPNQVDFVGCTPLMIAIQSPCVHDPMPYVKLLAQFGTDLDQVSKNPVQHFYQCQTKKIYSK